MSGFNLRKQQPLTTLGAAFFHSGLKFREAERFQHILPTAQPRILDFDGHQDRIALGLGQLFPCCTEPGLPDLVTLGLNLFIGLPLCMARSLWI